MITYFSDKMTCFVCYVTNELPDAYVSEADRDKLQWAMGFCVLNHTIDCMVQTAFLTCKIQGEETYDQDMKGFLFQNDQPINVAF